MPRPCGTVPLRCPSRSARANKGEEEGEGEGGAPCPLSLPSPATFFSFTASQTLSHPRRPATRGFPAARGPHLIRTFLRIPFLPPCLSYPVPYALPQPPTTSPTLTPNPLTPTSCCALPQPFSRLRLPKLCLNLPPHPFPPSPTPHPGAQANIFSPRE